MKLVVIVVVCLIGLSQAWRSRSYKQPYKYQPHVQPQPYVPPKKTYQPHVLPKPYVPHKKPDFKIPHQPIIREPYAHPPKKSFNKGYSGSIGHKEPRPFKRPSGYNGGFQARRKSYY